ncbi:ATP-binding protein [Fontivita pretiosa]|uniref:ATP-binding protein n=1 Tax=Fontivita pretiosa TaxID=2989684 RepID=UPI003D181E2F
MKHRAAILHYGCAVVSVAVALGAVRGIGPAATGVAPLFFAAVMISSWYGGLGPGLLACALAGLATTFFIIEPIHSFAIGTDDLIREIMFVAVSVLISSLHTSTRRSELRYRQAMEQANAANSAKDRFLAVLSHELRNPLTPVLAAATLRSDDAQLDSAIREDFRMIRRNIELEARLIDDLLDLNRLARGKLALARQTIDIGATVRDAVAICMPELNSKDLRLVMHDTATRREVHADPVRLRQVFWNLLKNAIKFTDCGGVITVAIRDAVSCELPGQTGGAVEVEVADTGIGIAPQALGRIFDAFEQGQESIARHFGGLGLGLAIARALVVAHRGSIAAHSDGPGRGARFTVCLPARTPAAQTTAAPPVAPDKANGRAAEGNAADGLHILLVEDHADTARLLARLLERSAHRVCPASSIKEALSMAREATDNRKFDLVISDIGLPDGSGIDLMRELRRTYGLPGIALTGYAMESDIRACAEAGFIEHVAKPVDLARLESAIRVVVKKRSHPPAPPVSSSMLPNGPTSARRADSPACH